MAASQTVEPTWNCLLQFCFFDCAQSHLLVRCTTLPLVDTSIHPKIFAPDELSFNETRREKKLPSSYDACYLRGLLSVSYLLLSRPIRSVRNGQRVESLFSHQAGPTRAVDDVFCPIL